MSGFSPEWLRLREPLDAASRDPALNPLPRRDPSVPLQVVDLGAGTGANLRYLAPLLRGPQVWLLIDDDPRVLEALDGEIARWASARAARVLTTRDELVVHDAEFELRVRRQRLDLAAGLEQLRCPDEALVTSSALLDLVSAAWLRSLALQCYAAQARWLFALTYDGRMSCSPVEAEDHRVRALFNAHQTTDKGFGGPALGPAAPAAVAQIFGEIGYQVTTRPSDWKLQPADRSLQAALVDGWLQASLETSPQEQAALRSWHRRRREHIDGDRSVLTVGHVDLVGWLPRERRSEH